MTQEAGSISGERGGESARPALTPVAPLSSLEKLRVRWRWLFTLAVPLSAAGAVMKCLEHGPLMPRLMFGFGYAMGVVFFTDYSIQCWRLKSRAGESAGPRP